MYMEKLQEVTPDATDNSGPIFDTEPVQHVQNNDNYNVFAMESEHPEQSKSIHDTYPIEQDEHNVIIDSLDMSYDREQADQDDNDDLANERELLASLIEKLKCEIDDSKNRNKFLETSNKALVDELKGEIEDFKNKNKSLESSNNHFKEANNKLSKTNEMMYNDIKKFQAELDRRNDVESQSTATRNRGKAIVNSPPPIYDQETFMVAKDDEMSKDKEIDKPMTLISLSFKKIYKPANNNLRTSSNTSRANQDNSSRINRGTGRANQDNSPKINRGTGYENQRTGNVDGAKETVGSTMVQKYRIQCYNCKEFGHVSRECQKPKRVKDDAYHREKMLLCKQEEAGIHLNAKTSNVNFVCTTCGKCVLNAKHDMCVLKYRNGVNSRTKMPMVVPVSTREPKRIVKQSVAKPLRKTVASESTNQKPKIQLGRYMSMLLVEIILFIVDSGCSKHMTGNLKLLINFVEKFLGTMKFGNNQIAHILGYRDLVQGAVTIKRVYYVKRLNHNLLSVGHFCDADLEVAFRKSTCYIRDLKGNDLLTGSHGTDLYSITLQDTSSPNPICLMAKATSFQAWLWHRRLSHLNFDTINLLSMNDILIGLPKLKFVKDHLCPSWINHQTSVAQTPEQNSVVERQNRTLVEAARTMLSAAKVPLFFWAEAIATTCFTQNRSLVIPRHDKTPYYIINDRKPSVKFFHIFGSLCYIVRDCENLNKMKEK
nr:integrase, catalytic region, zinc finger, CCHC-type, peptidase aspartic, catalytic [Tanacetum cinerariifolium]